ncbi:MAG: ATP-binding cassette domain-containing protein [Brevundimonas sp.]|uniref:ABC transporter ATP-binding protein n=1 Tax=Brevundimonas sp. TaxID=1871086 RepID=UPI0011FB31F1|nr:ATP-binding cassette domain-containing protein [Brevundimonas sp.]RZJ16436.1 MAG: ATP-binding cassette domain-containing protein [Brevundimonas sp.]
MTAATLSSAIIHYPSRVRPLGPLNLTVAAGEIVALVGASGSGKSTALRLLAGLEQPDEGTATRAAGPGRIGFVFQSATLAPWADALSNVALPLELSGVPRLEARRRATEALTAVGLSEALSARPAQLSGGMAMRVSLARALSIRPELLLLDEPFAALDTITRRALVKDLHALWAAGAPRPAIVFVTHDVEEAVYLAGRVVVLQAATGRAVADIPTPGALPRPPQWRAHADYRRAVEDVAAALSDAMGVPE